ncbi:MAG: glycine cleavage system protein H [Euryarchaeota archaeon]|nr:glycine cleavage system protein H [Euryarchaeota archaeon]
MSEIPEGLIYTKEHEWIKVEGNEITVGITDYAQNALTDVVWVELPELGVSVKSMDSFANVESVKSVSEIYAPVSGKVIEINEDLEDVPETVNTAPYGEGWICRMSMDNPGELDALLDAAGYKSLIEE